MSTLMSSMLFYTIIFYEMDTKFITLNVNGISTERKQKLLFDFLKMNDIKIICLQEHNIKDKGKLMNMFYDNLMLF